MSHSPLNIARKATKPRVFAWWRKWLRESDGVTAVEYAVMLALIIMTAMVSINSLVNAVRDSFEDTSTKLGPAISSSSS